MFISQWLGRASNNVKDDWVDGDQWADTEIEDEGEHSDDTECDSGAFGSIQDMANDSSDDEGSEAYLKDSPGDKRLDDVGSSVNKGGHR
jgi:hypothetical protein